VSAYDEPSQGHKDALSMLSEARSRVLEYLRRLQADNGSEGIHPNLVAAEQTPTLHSVATAALADYLIQLRPYRDSSSSWSRGFGRVVLPQTHEKSIRAFGRSGGDVYTLRGSAEHELSSLSDVINMAGYNVVYERQTSSNYAADPKIPQALDVEEEFETVVHQFVLTTEQLRALFETADDVAAEMGFLAEIKPSSNEDTEGF